jgi:hypothetical protein
MDIVQLYRGGWQHLFLMSSVGIKICPKNPLDNFFPYQIVLGNVFVKKVEREISYETQ